MKKVKTNSKLPIRIDSRTSASSAAGTLMNVSIKKSRSGKRQKQQQRQDDGGCQVIAQIPIGLFQFSSMGGDREEPHHDGTERNRNN